MTTPSEKIDQYIAKAGDWRGELITRIRKIIHEIEPGIEEEWKWNSPVFSFHGMVCSPGIFKNHVGVNFFQGAHLKDDDGLFNSGLEAKGSRSVKYMQGDALQEALLGDLIREAVAYNKSRS